MVYIVYGSYDGGRGFPAEPVCQMFECQHDMHEFVDALPPYHRGRLRFAKVKGVDYDDVVWANDAEYMGRDL